MSSSACPARSAPAATTWRPSASRAGPGSSRRSRSWAGGRRLGVDQTIYHKNLERVVYVFAETLGRTPAECVLDVIFDRRPDGSPARPARRRRMHGSAGPTGWVVRRVDAAAARRMRTFVHNGGGVAWARARGYPRRRSAAKGEWKITLDVFRDLGLAFGAAMVMIYVILVMQTGSFLIPLVVMLAIPLTVLGRDAGLLAAQPAVSGQVVGGYADPVLFTATAMIGMIALAGHRDARLDHPRRLHPPVGAQKGRPLFDAIMESRVVRMRPILLTAGAAMLSSIPITLDPIFSGLAWSLIFGLFASTIFTLFVIPVTYWLLHSGSVESEGGLEPISAP